MIIFYLSVGILYVILLRYLLIQWKKPAIFCQELTADLTPITLLLPIRNESQNISQIFRQVNNLDFPDLEIIWIDDHSEDDSLLILKKLWNENLLNHPMKVIGAKGIGKKAAIQTGVEVAKGDIIATTDADCQMPSDWLHHLLKPFKNTDIQLVAGPVISVNGDSFFSKFQQADWASILLVTCAGFRKGMPITCSGANLAYRKAAFNQINGFEGNNKWLSGDDEFILKKIVKYYGPTSAVYINDVSCLVTTFPFISSSRFLEQRKRWASKWNIHGSHKHRLVSILPFLFQLIFISSIYLFFLGSTGIFIFILFWAVKIMIEKRVLSQVLRDLKIKLNPLAWIGISFIHPVYVMATVLGAIKGNYIWKGRRNSG